MTTTPFLGCKISLISKSEIRYEGILYTIDPKESTIALAKVRSFGTEERVAERKVPPRDEIFEYIIFRAGDIKDLIVDDPPKSLSPGLADPAIIQAHSTSTTSSVTLPSPAFQQMTNSGIANNSSARQTSSAFHTTEAPTHVGNIPVSYTTTSDTHSGRSSPTTQRKSPQNLVHSSSGKSSPHHFVENRSRGGQHGGQRRGGGFGGLQYQYNRRGGGFRTQNNYSQPPQLNNRYSGNRAYDNRAYDNRAYDHRAYDNFNNYERMNQRRGPPMRPPMHQRMNYNRANIRAKDPIKFESEFDFEKSEQEFKELEQKFSNLKMEGEDWKKVENSETNDTVNNGSVQEKESQENDSQAYDKGKSFFDTISCEALERSKGNMHRIDWKVERKLNHETFGVSSGFRRQGFRGGFGRGRRIYRGGSFGSSRGGGGDSRRYSGGPNRK